jgi:hypothetical protein
MENDLERHFVGIRLCLTELAEQRAHANSFALTALRASAAVMIRHAMMQRLPGPPIDRLADVCAKEAEDLLDADPPRLFVAMSRSRLQRPGNRRYSAPHFAACETY